jgi:O-antigen/teichoic acid export membrane protein
MSRNSELLSWRLLTGNVVWNFAGIGLPLIVGIWAIPLIIEGMGTDRFGLLSIIWIGIGYFSLFDLGLGRALTQMVSERLGRGDETGLPALIRSGLTVMFVLGICALLLVILIAPYLSGSIFNIEVDLQQEALWSFWILALSLPSVIVSAGLVGVLQSYQRFKEIAVIRIFLGTSNFLGPLVMLYISNSLVATTATLAICRLLAWYEYHHLCKQHFSTVGILKIEFIYVKMLLSNGSWFMVSNIISPMMMYFDRFMIAGILSLTMVAYYTVPFDIITRLLLIPDALAGVFFPALAMALVAHSAKAKKIFFNVDRLLILFMLPILANVILFSNEGLSWWLGDEIATRSLTVLYWIAIGVYVNGQARLPYLTLQAAGRPDLTAKLHLVEIIPYFVCLYYGIKIWGIAGAAGAWTCRVLIDTVLLYWLSMRQSPMLRKDHEISMIIMTIATFALALLIFVETLYLKLLISITLSTICIFLFITTIIGQMNNKK